jgi:uncharacterized membrane protein/Mg-chelatase subunit ChlD
MISFAHPIALLLLVPALSLTLFAWRFGYANLSPRRMRVALAVRIVLLAALILGLAGLTIRLPQSRQATIFVTDLSASDAGQRSTMQSLLASAATSRPQSDVMGVVDTGRQPVVEQSASRLSGFDSFQSSVDPQYTNIESGLDLANALLPGGYRRRVVVVSDGQQNAGDALAAARLLRSQSVRVDVVPVRVPGGAEVLVDGVDVPSQLRTHESFALTVSVRSTVSTTTGITVFRDRTLIGSLQQAQVRPGENRFVFQQKPLSPGSYTYQVQITPGQDTQPENNQGSAFTAVTGAPRVLVIAADPPEAANVMASLRSTGIQADLKRPPQVPPTLGYLQRYAAVVIVDTAADVLGPDLMSQLVPYVRDLGHGLAVIGGQQSYSMGGYGQTPLEQALPVKMELPKRRDLPTTAVVLIIESLEVDTQINLSKEAGKGVVNLLTPQDQVAVDDTPFDGSPGWVVTLQHVTNKAAIDSAINRMAPGDPDSYAAYLQSAYNVLKHTNARIKHIILLGDGDAEDSTYQQLVQSIRAGGVTVSTVTTNGAGRNDFQTMQQIAQWGGGRNYKADDPSKIPQIFLREARTVARLGIVPGKFYPQELSANPMVRDMRTVAPLYGYLATTPKPAAEIVLASRKLDPVLAAWQFGLGRSVAWTSDAAGLWTKDWLRAPGANRFWANMVSWILPASGSGHLFISTSSSQGQGHISVTVPPSLGANPNVTARVLNPTLHTTTLELQPTAPGAFGGAFQEGVQGAYFITVEAHGGGRGYAGQVGMDVPYSQEYRTAGVNMAFLQQLAAAGGGTVISRPQDAWANNLSSVLAEYDLTGWLLLLAILLLPIDIGVRRLVVSRRELATILEALPRRKRAAPAAAEPALAPLGALRARRAQRTAMAPQTVGMSMARSSVRPAGGMAARRPAGSRVAEAEAGAEVEAGVEESIAGKLLAAKRRRS